MSIAWLAGRGVAIPGDELNEDLRRALVVRAVGGDPHRELQLDEDAVVRLADELGSEERRNELQRELESLREQASARPGLREAIVLLLADPELAWRAYACGLIAEAI